MSITIHKYSTKDTDVLIHFMVELQIFLSELDSMKRIIKGPYFETFYIETLLEKVKKNTGIIYFAYHGTLPIWIIAGIIKKQDAVNLSECVTSKSWKIIELFIEKGYRGQWVWTLLMQKIEAYFKQKKCDFVSIWAFAENIWAHKIYQHLGYKDRYYEMGKKI